ncbi:hypothetical protein [Clostridium tetani]|nr:hypothetical protein [Clostridium tetani]
MDNQEKTLERILRELQDIKVILEENCDATKISLPEKETVKK